MLLGRLMLKLEEEYVNTCGVFKVNIIYFSFTVQYL